MRRHVAQLLGGVSLSAAVFLSTAGLVTADSPTNVGSPCQRVNQVKTVRIKNKSTQLVCVQEGTRRVWRARIGGSSGSSGASGRHKFLNTTCTGSSDGRFTSKLTDLETLEVIVPPGVAAGWEIKPHGYVRIKGDRAAIYAPIDIELVQGAYYKEPPTFRAKTTYILHFAVGCEFAIFLDHITDPVDRIKAALNTAPNEDTRMDSFLAKPLSFRAGELIGYTIGAGPADSIRQWDFGYYSASVTNVYVNQPRRSNPVPAWKQLHAVCGFDYFAEPLKSTYARYFATHRGVLVPGAPCRSPNRDVAGTLAGSWYYKPDSTSIEPHVAIAIDLDGKSVIVAGLRQYVEIEASNPTLKDPANVTDRHCYYDSANGRYYFFQFVDRTTVDMFEGSGSCPISPSGTKTRLYR